MAAGFAIPLLKSLGRAPPRALPGLDAPPLDAQLPDESGALRSLSELRGRVTVVGALPLGDALRREAGLTELVSLRRRLRGLGGAAGFAVLCPGTDPGSLLAFLEAHRARRPTQLHLVDEGGREMRRLAAAAGSPGADWLLLDRQGRPRGAYPATPQGLDDLVAAAGQIANGADGPPGP